jgi:hypothetical protein
MFIEKAVRGEGLFSPRRLKVSRIRKNHEKLLSDALMIPFWTGLSRLFQLESRLMFLLSCIQAVRKEIFSLYYGS